MWSLWSLHLFFKGLHRICCLSESFRSIGPLVSWIFIIFIYDLLEYHWDLLKKPQTIENIFLKWPIIVRQKENINIKQSQDHVCPHSRSKTFSWICLRTLEQIYSLKGLFRKLKQNQVLKRSTFCLNPPNLRAKQAKCSCRSARTFSWIKPKACFGVQTTLP